MHECDPSGSPRRNALILASLLGGMALSGLALTTYFWLIAYRILQAKTFPPRGYPIIARTKVLVAHLATRKAVEFILFGVLAIAISIYVIWSVFSIFPETVDLLRPLYS